MNDREIYQFQVSISISVQIPLYCCIVSVSLSIQSFILYWLPAKHTRERYASVVLSELPSATDQTLRACITGVTYYHICT